MDAMTRGADLKRKTKGALIGSGLVQLAGRFTATKVVILRYHSVQDDPTRYSDSIGTGIIHATSIFTKQMEMVVRRFNRVTIDDILAFASGERPLPQRAVAVTFDDGFVDNYEIAAPILNRLGVRATFYITVNPVETGQPPWFCRLRCAFGTTRRLSWFDSAGNRIYKIADRPERKAAFLIASERCARKAGEAQEQILKTIEEELEIQPFSPRDRLMMTWDQVRALHSSGHIVGSHTLTHPNLACIGPEDLFKECAESKDKLEKELRVPVLHFSYPSPILQPHWTTRTVETTAKAGYRTAVTSTAGPIEKGQDPLFLHRVTVPSDLEQFRWVLECTLLGRRT